MRQQRGANRFSRSMRFDEGGGDERIGSQQRGASTSGAASYGGAPGTPPQNGASSGVVDASRNRFAGAANADPLEAARGAQDFLGQSATGFANQLMPGLMRGLQATRSRFGGGSIRSGGAQQGEEETFQRLFGNPLQDRISQLATTSLGYGQSEAQRGFENQGQVARFDQNRFSEAMGRKENSRQFDASMAADDRRFEAERGDRKKRGIGSLLGTLAGGVGGFMLGGPAGAFTGAGLGQKAFGG